MRLAVCISYFMGMHYLNSLLDLQQCGGLLESTGTAWSAADIYIYLYQNKGSVITGHPNDE